MKLFITLLAFMTSSMGYANCTITIFYSYDLQRVLHDNKGWGIEKEKFNKICNKLKEANLAVHFSQSSMISNSASVASTSIKFYPIEINKKYGEMVLTPTGYASVDTNTVRTSEVLDSVKFDSANNVLIRMIDNDEAWKEILDQVAFIRKHIK
jgi:hypothetical protein